MSQPDLFPAKNSLEKLDIPDADIWFMNELPTPLSRDTIFRRLFDETIWLHEQVTVYGKKYFQPRLIAWYGDRGKSYTYSGTTVRPLPWTFLLLELRRAVEEVSDLKFNSVLLNLYRDENDRMGFHSDNEKELGPDPAIASLSFGETRTLIFKRKGKGSSEIRKLALPDGSLLLMRGPTQRNWVHGIRSETRKCGPRINLTFRFIYI